jgi:dUTP pyrophosphatase
MSDVAVRVKRLSKHAVMPQYHSEGAAGMDLHAAIDLPMAIEPGHIVRVPCGIAISLPPGYEAQVRPRSGIASKHGIGMPNAPGTVDSDYRGELEVPLINLGHSTFVVEPRMRIAQMIVAPVARCTVQEVDELDDTSRGAGGFGSTGQ